MLAAVGAVIVIGPTSAFATSSAVCEQYPDLPQCESGAGSSDGTGSPSTGTGGASGPAGGAGGGAAGYPADGAAIPGFGDPATGSAGAVGELPFTGYPLTPLVLFLLVLLAGGLTARAYLATRGRLSAGTPTPGS